MKVYINYESRIDAMVNAQNEELKEAGIDIEIVQIKECYHDKN